MLGSVGTLFFKQSTLLFLLCHSLSLELSILIHLSGTMKILLLMILVTAAYTSPPNKTWNEDEVSKYIFRKEGVVIAGGQWAHLVYNVDIFSLYPYVSFVEGIRRIAINRCGNETPQLDNLALIIKEEYFDVFRGFEELKLLVENIGSVSRGEQVLGGESSKTKYQGMSEKYMKDYDLVAAHARKVSQKEGGNGVQVGRRKRDTSQSTIEESLLGYVQRWYDVSDASRHERDIGVGAVTGFLSLGFSLFGGIFNHYQIQNLEKSVRSDEAKQKHIVNVLSAQGDAIVGMKKDLTRLHGLVHRVLLDIKLGLVLWCAKSRFV